MVSGSEREVRPANDLAALDEVEVPGVAHVVHFVAVAVGEEEQVVCAAQVVTV